VRNITLSLDDETYRQARIRAAEGNTSVSGFVKQLLTSNVSPGGPSGPDPAVLQLAAELRALTAARPHSAAEELQREGREER
jgi:plasmid stability protein